MRALRVLGIADGGDSVVCVAADAERTGMQQPTQYTIPIDERLRAAVRGDLSRFGQLEIEMAPQLRPREIQSRIRAGASVEQVAAAAGCTPERIDRYAYPVLLERATIAERARAVCPLQGATMGTVSAANSRRTLEDIVMGTLTDRGQQQGAEWDAFKDERGWTVTLTWRAGRSENRAEWAFAARPDGGTVAPRNAEAADLVEPGPAMLRTIGNTVEDGPTGRDTRASARGTAPASDVDGEPRLSRDEHLVVSAVVDERSAAHLPADGAATPRPATRAAKRGHRPPMPSWEDVLLGTRAAQR